MSTPIAFTPVTAPKDTDFADGTTAYNVVAGGVEKGYDLTNAWAAKVPPVIASKSATVGTALFTPAAGWALSTGSINNCYARKWGNTTYVSLAIQRTGANLAPDSAGNVTDQHVGTVAVPYRPIRNQMLTATYHSYSACLVYLNTAGYLYLQAMSQGSITIFSTSRYLFFSAFWISADPMPI